MLSKHFAVLGTTGVGKSSAVALILQQILAGAAEPAHLPARRRTTNTAAASATRAYVVNPGNLKLPFWLFNFEEIVDVIFGGRPGARGGDRDPRPR